MTVCSQSSFEFPVVDRRRVQTGFTGGDISSEGGLLLLRQVDRRLPLPARLAKRLPDSRDPTRVMHPLVTLLRQRLYGLCQGYEELNDHDRLRTDVARRAWPMVKGLGGLVFTVHEKSRRTFRKTYPTHQIHQKSSFSTAHATSGLSYSRLASRFFNAGSVC